MWLSGQVTLCSISGTPPPKIVPLGTGAPCLQPSPPQPQVLAKWFFFLLNTLCHILSHAPCQTHISTGHLQLSPSKSKPTSSSHPTKLSRPISASDSGVDSSYSIYHAPLIPSPEKFYPRVHSHLLHHTPVKSWSAASPSKIITEVSFLGPLSTLSILQPLPHVLLLQYLTKKKILVIFYLLKM